jgi:hypothetical protein
LSVASGYLLITPSVRHTFVPAACSGVFCIGSYKRKEENDSMIEKDNKQKKGRSRSTSMKLRQNGIYEVVWPYGEKVGKISHLAKRLDTLNGKTVCEIWDYVFKGDKIFPILEKELAKQYPGIKFVNYSEFGSTHGGEEKRTIASLPSKLKENRCDAVISAVGC